MYGRFLSGMVLANADELFSYCCVRATGFQYYCELRSGDRGVTVLREEAVLDLHDYRSDHSRSYGQKKKMMRVMPR